MMKKEDIHEIAMISAIMADHCIDRLIKVQKNGYLEAADMIGKIAMEFFEEHKDIDWEKVLEEGIPTKSNYLESIICWDDACIDYCFHKIKLLDK